MRGMPNPSVQVNVRTTPALYERIREMASSLHVSVPTVIEWALWSAFGNEDARTVFTPMFDPFRTPS